MNTPAVIVAGADASYFVFLRELALSLDACGALQRWDFVVLDVGLTEEQRTWLRNFGVTRIVRPNWPFTILSGQQEWTKACYCRPFLPELLPDWPIIVYFDADSWLQDISAITEIIRGAEEEGFAVIPLIERAHWPPHGKVPVLASMKLHKSRLEKFYGAKTAEQLQLYPLIVSGFFAGRRDAPHWQVWRNAMAQGLENHVDFSIDQASLTLAIYQPGLSTAFLPHDMHWHCHKGMIGLDTRSGIYVEPHLPHRLLGSIALAAHAKSEPVPVKTTDGRTLFRYPRFSTRGTPFAAEVVIDGTKHVFDGIASTRFRDKVFAALSHDNEVRFVQIGAMDGVCGDPIHHFVLRNNWCGVLAEPLPDMVESLRRNYAACGQRLRHAQCAITDCSGPATITRVRKDAGHLPDWAFSLSSLVPERTMLSGRRISKEMHAAIEAACVSEQVPALSFGDFVTQYEIETFDLLLIDTEGFDHRILRQVDLIRFATKCVHMEIINLPAEEVASSVEQLHTAGFVCYAMNNGKDLLAIQRHFGSRHFGQL